MSKKSSGSSSFLFSKINMHYVVMIAFIILVVIVMSIRSPYFLTIGNWDVLLNNFVMEAIMALGMTMVIISGGIDISLSGVLPFTAIILALMLKKAVPIGAAIPIALAAACCIGLLNNELRRILRIHPMIVTMAMQLTLKGLNLAITSGAVVSGLPNSIKNLSKFHPLGISLSLWVYIVLVIFFITFSKNNRTFLSLYFIGGNKDAAVLSGMNVEGILRFVYMLNAGLAGLAGILSTTVYYSASYSFGQGVENRVIAAVAIGGTSLTHGGDGSIVGTLIGTLFMALINNVFVMSGISTYYQDVFTGIMLIVAILLSEAVRVMNSRQRNKQAAAC